MCDMELFSKINRNNVVYEAYVLTSVFYHPFIGVTGAAIHRQVVAPSERKTVATESEQAKANNKAVRQSVVKRPQVNEPIDVVNPEMLRLGST